MDLGLPGIFSMIASS